jgi:Icc-related predicted phosphoesterase
LGDAADAAHRGFEAFARLVKVLGIRLLVHGHVHPYGSKQADRQLGEAQVVNAIPSRLLEL